MNILIDGQTLHTPEIKRGIGTYFKNTLERILEYDFVNDFFILTRPGQPIECLSHWAQNRLEIIHIAVESESISTNNVTAREREYSAAVNHEIQRLGIDLYWIPNALMDNVFLPVPNNPACKFAVTVFDLIFDVMENHFAGQLSAEAIDAYRNKLRTLGNHYDLFLHISQHTQKDFIRTVGLERGRQIVTPLAAAKSYKPYPFPAVPPENNYILYTGGFDPRKNMDQAVRAFAKLIERYSGEIDLRSTRFVIVCNADDSVRDRLMKFAEGLGVADRLRLTGFVTEPELVSLYQRARCLFFPSLYEGFGLPVVEALACGIPVVASGTSSIPEVGSVFASYFDPTDVDEMALRLCETLRVGSDCHSRQRRHEYSLQFSWESTAQATLAAFEQVTAAPPAACGREVW
jgi:glycosyltransferase involved in cell wall biosynthesis